VWSLWNCEILDADQADREVSSIDWDVVNPRDEARRSRVAEILASGVDLCPEDFYNAAMVYQHGREAPEYLMAHILASASAMRGYEPAGWLMASSLDRYLKAIEQPQIFGTQFNRYRDDQPWTQEPFDRTFLSLALRDLFNVADPEEQASRLDGLNNSE
jgi:hypothetical protein